jgi:signal transduction histidine kinase/DNA-binding response OmpR family regulator
MLLNGRKLRAGSHSAIIVLAMEDVTERRRAEEEVGKAKEASEAANQTKSLFLANMSHELRTPLNAIVGYSEMLQEEAAEKNLDSFVSDLEKINGAGRQLLGLINDILDLSKIEAGKMELFLEDFDLLELIEEVSATIQPMVKQNANELKIECAANLGEMHGDQVKVRQALFNLLSNATKFTHEGFITLNAKREVMNSQDWITFKVSDTGIGLSEDQILNLFQNFTQADPSTTKRFGGTGLGLALTRQFCQMMGGDVTVSSVSHEGSTFTIKLPAVVVDEKPENTEESFAGVRDLTSPDRRSTQAPLALSTCVLVIDDNPVQRDLMQRFLEKEGFHVRCAANGEEGLRLAKDLLPIAITLDVMMPGMDGWKVLQALKADSTLREIPVIMLTMVDDPQRGAALGATDYITKPVNRQRLTRILKRYSCASPPCPVLLVEDDSVIRESMRRMLENHGCRVTEAQNGEAALFAMERDRPSLVFLDLMMPVMDGFTFTEHVRAHEDWRSIPIVVVTAHDLTADERRRLNGYVDTILQKAGQSTDDLFCQVLDALDNSSVPRLSTV